MVEQLLGPNGLPYVDPLTADVLPDSRASFVSTPRGARNIAGAWFVPIFCPSCGAEGGMVPQENMTFAFWLCNLCFEKYGELTNLMVMPDEVFWSRVKAEQVEEYGRLLSTEEIVAVVEANATPLSTLILEGR